MDKFPADLLHSVTAQEREFDKQRLALGRKRIADLLLSGKRFIAVSCPPDCNCSYPAIARGILTSLTPELTQAGFSVIEDENGHVEIKPSDKFI